MGCRIELVDCERHILEEIADKRFKRKDIALSYYFCMAQRTEKVDWFKINGAIIERWSMSGLDYIKTLAWKRVKPARSGNEQETN